MYTAEEVAYFRAAVLQTAILSAPWIVGLALAYSRRESHPGVSLLASAGFVVLLMSNVGLLLNAVALLDGLPYHPRFWWLSSRGVTLLGQGLLVAAVFSWRPPGRPHLAGLPSDAAAPAPRPTGGAAIREVPHA